MSRMVLTVGLGIYGTRLYFQAIDTVDIGLFNLLGASAGLLTILTTGLSSSAVRHLSYSLENEDTGTFTEYANTTYGVFLACGVVIVLLGEAMTPLLAYLDIPDDRRDVAFWVYQLSVLSVAQVAMFAPITSVFVSRQAMVLESTLTLPMPVLNLAVIMLLFVLPGDRLLNFAVMMFAARLLLGFVQAGVCFWVFPDARIRPQCFRRSLVSELVQFAGWTTLSASVSALRIRGTAIVLNLFFGPLLNAAWEAVNRLNTYLHNGLNVFFKALSPAIFSAEGAGRRPQAIGLTLALCRYSSLACLYVAAPAVADMQNLLVIWLEEPPPYAVSFAAISLTVALSEALTRGCAVGVQATGEIGRMVRLVASISIMTIPLACVAFAMGAPPQAVLVISLLTTIVAGTVRVHMAGSRLGFGHLKWLREVVFPVAAVLLCGALAMAPVRLNLPPGMGRLLAVTATYALVGTAATWLFAIPEEERRHFRRMLTLAKTT
ncbi:MAG: hypothetical protein AAGF31_02240 [Planctomycetota bacterium]